MRHAVKRVAQFCFVLCVLLSCLFFATFGFSPDIASKERALAEDYASLANISKKLLQQRQGKTDDIDITLLSSELRSLEKVVESQISDLRIHSETTSGSSTVYVSYAASNKLWLNVTAIKKDGLGVLPDTLKIGAIPVPKPVSDFVLSTLIRHYTKETAHNFNLNLLKFSFTESSAQLQFSSKAFNELKISKLLNVLSQFHTSSKHLDKWVNDYYRNEYLRHASELERQKAGHSISKYLSHINEVRPATTNTSKLEHVQQSLLALSTLVGVPIYNELFAIPRSDNTKVNFTLEQRTDLAKHFLISAGMRILSNADTSFAVGAAKELMDSRPKGSGFSFKDLAADRAGITFVDKINQGNTDWLKITSERDFFPEVSDLAEGLSEQEFAAQYQSTSGSDYKKLVSEIEARIAATPFYN